MNTFSLLLYAIFFAFFLLMSVPTVIACYRYWFRGGKLLSERLDAHFRSPPRAHAHHGRKKSEKNPGLSRTQSKSITNQSTHPIRTYNSIERR